MEPTDLLKLIEELRSRGAARCVVECSPEGVTRVDVTWGPAAPQELPAVPARPLEQARTTDLIKALGRPAAFRTRTPAAELGGDA